MEILIPGLILVALMAYASTKIKKNAARAFEQETVETDEFSIIKPEGFISPIGDGQNPAFLAYSKDFGSNGAENIRQASATINTFDNADLNEICQKARQSVTKIASERTGESGNGGSCIIEAESYENGIPTDVYYKIAAGSNKVYELRAALLSEHKDNFSRRIEGMIDSFVVK